MSWSSYTFLLIIWSYESCHSLYLTWWNSLVVRAILLVCKLAGTWWLLYISMWLPFVPLAGLLCLWGPDVHGIERHSSSVLGDCGSFWHFVSFHHDQFSSTASILFPWYSGDIRWCSWCLLMLWNKLLDCCCLSFGMANLLVCHFLKCH